MNCFFHIFPSFILRIWQALSSVFEPLQTQNEKTGENFQLSHFFGSVFSFVRYPQHLSEMIFFEFPKVWIQNKNNFYSFISHQSNSHESRWLRQNCTSYRQAIREYFYQATLHERLISAY